MGRKKKNIFDSGGMVYMDLSPVSPVKIPTVDTSNYTPIASIDVNKKFGKNPSKLNTAPLSAVLDIGGNALGNFINNNGYSTDVGNAISGVGNATGKILGSVNPILGAAVSGASGLVGSLYNAAFGSKINEAKVAEVENDNRVLNSFMVDNSTSTNLLNQFGAQDWGNDFSQGDIGSDGWFSDKAENEYNRLKREREMALINTVQKYNAGAVNLAENQGDSIMATLFSKGGKIHIKDNKRGWNNTHGGDFSNGVIQINSGGLHSTNPFEGVQLGVDNQGIPNLVEEGEVIWNDYVFSNRIKAPKEVKKTLKLRGETFADLAKNVQKESVERPNDPISKRGLDSLMSKLASYQEAIRNGDGMKIYGNGDNGNRKFDAGGKLTPYTNFSLLTDDSFYTPSYMRFWNWVKDNPNDINVQRLLSDINNERYGNIGGNTLAYDDMVRLAHDYKSGPVHQAFVNAMKDYKGYSIPNAIKFKAPMGDGLSRPYTRTPNNKTNEAPIATAVTADTPAANSPIDTGSTWLRYVPAIGSGLNYITDTLGITNVPDYSPAEAILNAGTRPYNPIRFNPLGRYMAYKPFDRDYYINKFNANSAATKRAIKNTAGNRGAMIGALLASDYNYGNSLGDLARQAEEYNLNQRNTVDTFNRDTDKFNSTMGLDVDRINQAERANLRNLKYNATVASNAFRDEIDKRISAARSYNLTNFLDNLGDIGREDVIAGWVANNPALYYYFDRKGAKTPYKKSAKGGKIKRGGKQWLTL